MEINSIPVEFLFTARISGLGQVFRVPNTPSGNRLLVPAVNGTFEGPRMRGVYMPGLCVDYATQLGDETFLPDVRLALQTHDGHILLAHQMGRLSPFYTRGREPGTWRIALTFESAPNEYAWLNEVQAIGIGKWLSREEIEYNVYVVL
jgi:hypothetical protein